MVGKIALPRRIASCNKYGLVITSLCVLNCHPRALAKEGSTFHLRNPQERSRAPSVLKFSYSSLLRTQFINNAGCVPENEAQRG